MTLLLLPLPVGCLTFRVYSNLFIRNEACFVSFAAAGRDAAAAAAGPSDLRMACAFLLFKA